ncbi:MAG: hypothetical protein AAFQ08_00745 [Bacteroidota bacterium]
MCCPLRCLQARPQLRHTASFQGIEAQGVYHLPAGPGMQVAYSRYLSRKLCGRLAVMGQYSRRQQSLQLQPSICWSGVQHSSVVYGNVVAGVFGVWHKTQRRRYTQPRHGYNAGVVLGAGVEVFLTNHLVLLVEALPAVCLLKVPQWSLEMALTGGVRITF